MKKIIFFSISFIIVIFNVKKVEAASTYFQWIKTEIEVPLNANLANYENDFVVELYVNGEKSNDFVIEKETNCSSFSTVLTHRVGRYTVFYQAISKANNLRSEQAIVFNVVDNINPTIECSNKLIELPIGASLNLADYVDYKDNYTLKENLIIKYDDSQVNYQMLGVYPLIVTVIDEANNSTTEAFEVKIVDKVKPSIRQIKSWVINYRESFKLTDFFLALDNYDGNISNAITCSEYDVNKLGAYPIVLKVSDSSGNITEATFILQIIDGIAPEIVLTNEEITLSIDNFEEYDETYFQNYIQKAYDNYQLKEVKIDIHSLKAEVGYYPIKYLAIDNFGNSTEKVLYVRLVEKKGPELIAEGPLRFLVNSSIDYLALVTVNDPYDLEAYKRLEIIDNQVNPNVVGKYPITYQCYNSSGEVNLLTIEIEIYEEEQENNLADLDDVVLEDENSLNYILIIGLVGGGLVIFIIGFFLYKKFYKF